MHHSCVYVEQIVCKCQQFSSPSLGNQKINQSTNRNHFYGVYKNYMIKSIVMKLCSARPTQTSFLKVDCSVSP